MASAPSATEPEGRLRIGVVGLGQASSGEMLEAFCSHGGYTLAGGADPDEKARRRFADRYGAAAWPSAEELWSHRDLDVCYVATPTRLHEAEVVAAVERGLHVLVEKPIALTVSAAERMIDAARSKGVHLFVCHKHSVDRPVLTMLELIRSGAIGPVQWIHRIHFNDWFYRPRAEADLGPAEGGAVLRQGSHEFDIVRLLASDVATEVSGRIRSEDPRRPGEGSFAATVGFANGVVGTVVFSGYDRFPSEELTSRLVEPSSVGATRRALAVARDRGMPEEELRRVRRPGRSQHGVYGFTLVCCAGGDLRPTEDGNVWMYGPDGRRLVEATSAPSGADFIVHEIYAAVVEGRAPLHDGSWGLANLELCLAARESDRIGLPVALRRQQAPG